MAMKIGGGAWNNYITNLQAMKKMGQTLTATHKKHLAQDADYAPLAKPPCCA